MKSARSRLEKLKVPSVLNPFAHLSGRVALPLLSCCLLFSLPSPGIVSADESKTVDADVVIYGNTSAAVIAAVQVKQMGKSAVIVGRTSTWEASQPEDSAGQIRARKKPSVA